MNPTMSQVATPTTAVFPEQSMADVIDSLKRLERLGDENSKTVQKILQASKDIEQVIVSQYPGDATISSSQILLNIVKRTRSSLVAAARSIGVAIQPNGNPAEFRYTIESSSNISRCLYRDPQRVSVSGSRESALGFAKDLSMGLLAVIAEDLLQQQRQNDDALTMLKQANKALSKQADPVGATRGAGGDKVPMKQFRIIDEDGNRHDVESEFLPRVGELISSTYRIGNEPLAEHWFKVKHVTYKLETDNLVLPAIFVAEVSNPVPSPY